MSYRIITMVLLLLLAFAPASRTWCGGGTARRFCFGAQSTIRFLWLVLMSQRKRECESDTFLVYMRLVVDARSASLLGRNAPSL